MTWVIGDPPSEVAFSKYGTCCFRLPPFSIKDTNIVPVHLMLGPNRDPLVFTAFNNSTLISWLSPVLVKGKPIINFAGPLHAVVSKKGTITLTTDMDSLTTEEQSWIDVEFKFMKKTQTERSRLSNLKSLRNFAAAPKDGLDKPTFDISRCKFLVLTGTRARFISFSGQHKKFRSPPFMGPMLPRLAEIADSIKNLEKEQNNVKTGINRIEGRLDDMRMFIIKVSDEIARNPERIADALESQIEVLDRILHRISIQLEGKDTQNAKIAEGWRHRLADKAAKTADFLQIIQFVTGMTSAHMLGITLMREIARLLQSVRVI